ncbi:MAG: F0F1 ATP synthase subunit A [Pseudomonadota bacterium]
MDQFIIKPLGGGGALPGGGGDGGMSMLAVTNSTIWMVLAVVAVAGLMIFGTSGRAIVPSRVQSVAEILYGFIRDMVTDVLGEDGPKFFPYIFVLFMFVMFSNVLGIIPASFTTTSHIAVTGVLALAVFFSVIVIGFYRHGAGFLKLFWVDSAPLALRPVLALIEIISFFVRPVSHSIRLAGNMMAGHAVMKVFAAFVPAMGAAGILPLAMMVGLTGFEILVACVQAYIFAMLTCIYLNDALHPGH